MAADPNKWQVHGGGYCSNFVSKTDRSKIKTVTSTELGPGTYSQPEEYLAPAHVPFNTKTDRFRPPPRAIGETPELLSGRGPGQYDAPDEWKVQPNHAPFAQRSERTLARTKTATPDKLGPGCYKRHEDWNSQISNAPFGQKSERFRNLHGEKTTGTLGPGCYPVHLVNEFEKRTPNAVGFISKVERMTSTGAHTDMRRRSKLGPGYYGGPEPWAAPTNHAPFNSHSDRFAVAGRPRSNSALGPGSYGGHKSY